MPELTLNQSQFLLLQSDEASKNKTQWRNFFKCFKSGTPEFMKTCTITINLFCNNP